MNRIDRAELDAVRNHISNIPSSGAMYAFVLVEHCRALLDEVERLTADPLPAAAWVREVERAAFKRGAEAMREVAAQRCEVSPIHGKKTTTARRYADAVRALPVPEAK